MKELNSDWHAKLMLVALTVSTLVFAANTSVIGQESWPRGDEWRAQYKVGDKTSFSISGNAADHQICTVSENSPQGIMRVACGDFKQWTAGNYIVYGKNYIRPQQAVKTGQTQKPNETQAAWNNGDEWRREFAVGDKIQFTISGKAADLQTCAVAENSPQAVMRVKCNDFRQWEAGTYIVHSEANLKPTNTESANQNGQPTKPPASSGKGLKIGEYACYGSGGRIMIGLGFKVLAGNRYTDLDGGNRGTFVIAGNTVKFRGGHMGGQTGRDLKSYNFTIGTNAGCEPF